MGTAPGCGGGGKPLKEENLLNRPLDLYLACAELDMWLNYQQSLSWTFKFPQELWRPIQSPRELPPQLLSSIPLSEDSGFPLETLFFTMEAMATNLAVLLGKLW